MSWQDMFVLLLHRWQGDIYSDEIFPYPQETLRQARMKTQDLIHLPTHSCQLSFEMPGISCLASNCSWRRAEVLSQVLYHICQPLGCFKYLRAFQIQPGAWIDFRLLAQRCTLQIWASPFEREEFTLEWWFGHRDSGGGWVLSPKSGYTQHKIAAWVRFLSYHYGQ